MAEAAPQPTAPGESHRPIFTADAGIFFIALK
jgi:hypothetical protein